MRPLAARLGAWRAAGGVNASEGERLRREIEGGGEGAFVSIRKGQVHILVKREGFQSKTYGALMLLHRLVSRFGRTRLPDMEFGIHRGDVPKPGAWMSFCGRRGELPGTWLYPDFGYYAWPEIMMPPWEAIRQRTQEVVAAHPFAARSSRMFWRGGAGKHINTDVRGKLLRALENRTDIADVRTIPTFDVLAQRGLQSFTPLWDFCKHKYILYTEGNSYSGRLKYHVLCGSVIISHPRKYDTMLSALMQEGSHIVTTADNEWSDVAQVHQRLESNPRLAESIGNSTARLGDLLTEDGVSCYLLALLRAYAAAMTYAPPPPPPGSAHLEAFVLGRMKGVAGGYKTVT
ncbi:hypothetical protein HXX76_013553 [Chlamydomonas incerta]|uniref:Glycosyl transferase CAP10 domain-containing protein n=1 Tax=Chlamydomonas incerta TaxID=51695 RepID=A0A835VUJ3_CHLIN|nr:hypothetical protein HXX76_013553 [Chlamydomonas incerta]|eukprot:KAG2425711.1 hypothetical protein HXX76_013553 [Chlamydomonas incerta]